MGQEIVYCGRCQRRISGSEFESGKAFQIDHQFVCSTCAAEVLPTLELKDRERLLKDMFKATRDRRSTSTASLPAIRGTPAKDRGMSGRKTTASIPIVKPPHPATNRSAVKSQPSIPTFLLAAGIGAGILLLVLYASSGSSAPTPRESDPESQVRISRKTASPRPTEDPAPSRSPTAPDPAEAAAVQALKNAEFFQSRNPQDVDGILREWAARSEEHTSE